MGPNTELQVVLFHTEPWTVLTLYGYGVRQYACPDMDAYPNLWYLVFFGALSYTVYVVDLYSSAISRGWAVIFNLSPFWNKTGIKQPKVPMKNHF